MESLYTRSTGQANPLLTKFREYITGDDVRDILTGSGNKPCGNPRQEPCPTE